MSGVARGAPGAHRPGFAGVTDRAGAARGRGGHRRVRGRSRSSQPVSSPHGRPRSEAGSTQTAASAAPRWVQGPERCRRTAGLRGTAGVGGRGRCGLLLGLLRPDGAETGRPILPVPLPVSFSARVLGSHCGEEARGGARRLRLRAERTRGSSRPRARVSRNVCVVGGKQECACRERRQPSLVFARNSRARPVQIRKVDFLPFSQKRGQHLECQNLGMWSLSVTLWREGDAASQPHSLTACDGVVPARCTTVEETVRSAGNFV